MTTPRPTAELVTAPHLPDAPELPSWLPDEATLNRLAGEFFAALPGGAPTAGGGIGQAPRVDVPARSSDAPAAPLMTDPAAAVGAAPTRSIPDSSEAGAAFGSAARAAPPAGPESAIGVTGLQLTPPGELTPPTHGLAAPYPAAGAPGPPASDQPVTGGGMPTPSIPDVTAAAPVSTYAAVATPAVPAVPQVPGVTGATGAIGAPGESVAEPEGRPTPTALPDAPPLFGADLYRPPVSVGLPSVPQPPMAVPEAPAPVPTPSTPYYFIAESSPYRGDAGELNSLASAALTPLPPPVVEPPVGATGTTGVGLGRAAPFDVHQIRRDFPILSERINGKPLVWLDNAATTQKPQAVLDRLAHFYEHENSNIHRAAHELAARATDAYEGARKKVARFIGASSEKEIIFVRGATEAINLVAKSWGRANIHRGDEIIVSHLEHHANIVPWQQLIAETGAVLRVIPVDDSGQLILSEYGRLLSEKTKLVAVTQVSNALGTVTPVDQIVEMGHRAGACVLIDGAQSVPHIRVNMQALGVDFFVFSGHKIFGPTGIGVVYGRAEVLESMPPWEGGGNMIADVTFEKTVFQHPPNRFEAGTGNIADAVGLGAALDYVSRFGVEAIAGYEHSLLEYATPRMLAVPGLRMIGTAAHKTSVLSFVLDGYRPEEVGTALNQEGIAVRAGHHCAQPILRRFGVEATVRPSLAFYNTVDEIDLLVALLHRLAAQRGRR